MADPAGFSLPPEFQQALDEATRRQQIAKMLTERTLNFQGPQQVGRVAARISPLASFANLAGGVAGGYLGGRASQDLSKVRQDYSNAEAADLARIQGLPEAQGIEQGTLSQFIRSRELAKSMRDQMEKRREAGAKFISDAGDPAAAIAALNNPVGATGYTPKPPVPPAVSIVQGAKGPETLLTNTGLRGQLTGQLGGVAPTVNNILPTKQGEMALGILGDELKSRGAKAQAAKDTMAAANYATDAMEAGAKAGGGQEMMQALRKGLQAVGVDLPETASTEQLQMGLLQGVLANASKLRPASDTDLKILKQMVGSAGSDPVALTKALAFAHAMSFKDLQGYNDYAEENKKNLNPDIQSLFSGATSGYEVPGQLPGPQAYQMEVVRQLQRQGFDISRLADPSGKPFDRNSKFDIAPTQGFPGVAKPSPDAKTAQPLSPAERQELEQLRKQLRR